MHRIRFAAVLLTLGVLQSIYLFGQQASKLDAQSTSRSSSFVDHKYEPARNAAADIKQAITDAQMARKRVLLDIGGEWCPWCRTLGQFFKEHPDVLQVRDANFITVRVYYGADKKNEQVLSHYPRVLGIPHYFVLDETGTLLHSQHMIELQTNGIYSSEKIREFLAKWSSPAATALHAQLNSKSKTDKSK